MICTLMNKNTPIIKLEVEDGEIEKITEIYDIRFLPPSVTVNNEIVNKKALREWWKNRCIPASRDKLCEGMLKMGYEFWGDEPPTFLLEKSFGLSLSDQYWLKPENSNIEWKDVNYFENDFSDDVGKALFDNQYVSTPNLNSPCNSSDGWLKKKWIISSNKRLLVKASSMPFLQESYNEVIAGEICKSLKINHVEYNLSNIKDNICCVCENFITPNTEFITASSLMDSVKKQNHHSRYEHLQHVCRINNIVGIDSFLDEMLVLDYVIGNTDRHLRNFGVIRNVETLKYEGFAPIFDTGTSLLCNVPTEQIEYNCEISAKPFFKTQCEQIKLVKNPERFEIEKLKSVPEFAREVLYANNNKFEQRKNMLCDVLSYRISALDKAFCKGYQSISLDASLPNFQHKGKSV